MKKISLSLFGILLFLSQSIAYADVAPGPPPTIPEDPFTDVHFNRDADYFSAENIEALNISYLKTTGIIHGYADGSFHPDSHINRVEFTKILVEAADKSDGSCHCGFGDGRVDGLSFTDTDADAWYAPSIQKAFSRDIIGGYPDGSFRPGNAINFAEAAKMIIRTFEHSWDVPPGAAWYQPYIDRFTVLQGGYGHLPMSLPSGDHLITRSEMVALISLIRTSPLDPHR